MGILSTAVFSSSRYCLPTQVECPGEWLDNILKRFLPYPVRTGHLSKVTTRSGITASNYVTPAIVKVLIIKKSKTILKPPLEKKKKTHQKWTAVTGQNILPLFQESQFNCRCQLQSRCWAQFLRRGKEKISSPPVPLRQSGFSAASSVPGAEVGEGSRGGGSSRGRGTRRGAEAGGNPTENGGGRELHRGWRGGSLEKQRTRLWPTPRTPPSATRQAASRRQNLLNNTF